MLYTLEIFAEFTYNNELLVKYSDLFVGYFNKYLSDPDADVKIEAASSFTNFLSFINEEKDILKYQSAFPILMELLIEAVRSNEERGLKMVNSLDHLIKSHPKFVKDSLDRLLDIFTEMAGEKGLADGLRNAAMLVLISIAINNPQAVKKSKIFTDKTIPVLMQILTEQPDDLSDWLKSEDTHELSSQGVQAIAVENFSRLNESLGSKYMLQKTISIAFKYISSDNWKVKYAGLMSLGMLFEGSKKHFADELANFIQLLVPTLSFGNPKVLYASMTCIALLATEFTPELQTQYHGSILPPVIAILKSSPEDKLKNRAVSMLINFFRELLEFEEEDRSFMDQYVPQIMESLLQMFENFVKQGKVDSVEEVVSLISILAAISAEKFSAYYSRLMPGLKSLVYNTPNTTEANNKIRALSISTMGYVLASYRANPQDIESDILEIMKYLVELQKTLPAEDAQHKAILEVYEVLVGALREKFLPFMAPVVEHTLACAQRDINLVVEDHLGGANSKTSGNSKADQQMVIDLKILGGQKMISMSHSNLEQKLVAFDMIRQLAKVLKKNLRPYLEPLTKIVFEHLDYKFSSGIREFCYKSLKHLMGVCSTEAEAQQIFENFAPKLLNNAEAFLKIENDEKSHNILKHLKAAGEVLMTSNLNEQLINRWFEVLKLALHVCGKRKQEVIAEYGDVKNLDEETRDDFEADFAEPNMLMHVTMDTASLIMKLYKSKYEKLVIDGLGSYFYNCSKNWVVEDELHYAVCFYAEVFNNCSQQFIEQGYSVVLDTCLPQIEKTDDINFQQTAAFLIGILAKKCTREQFAPYLPRTLALLTKELAEPDAQSEDKKTRTETVLGAFGKLCLYQLPPADAKTQERTINFVKCIPLQTDPEEAQYINRLFLKELNRKNQALMASPETMAACKEAVQKMAAVATNNPELEVLSDEGKTLLQQTLPLIN
jgi:hypothetical protein